MGGSKKKGRQKSKPTRREIPLDELKSILERARSSPLGDEDVGKLTAAVETLAVLTQALESKDASIRRLRQMIFGASTEKTSAVVGDAPGADAAGGDESSGSAGGGGDGASAAGGGTEPKEKRKGHGRNGAAKYTGAERVKVPHEKLRHGDRCPACERGKLYVQLEPAVLVRVVGMAPLAATVYELERLRCNLCGEVFTARAPEGVGKEKYDEPAAGMIGLLKYGCGLPFNRLERLERGLGIPLPAATQWEVVERGAGLLAPAYGEIVRQAAQGEVLHNDDTTMKILALMVKPAEGDPPDEEPSERTGIFTSGIVSVGGGRRIALFFTGRKHAGENLGDVLAQRARELSAPIQMCD
ncbi:MAG TPA: transposase, partial [Polyangia bacterium]|nr:transposase [Polyangia bacterium]